MPHEVKMPQLGMTQDSGVIVSWLKSAGDVVSEGDALFEVETDKATMEVEAQSAGYLAGVRAGEGDDVPVGDVIALIVDSEAEIGDHASADPAQPPEKPAPAPQPQPEQSSESAPKAAAVTAPPVTTGKVLASPKAKRLAREKGIDLSVLRAQGVNEPIHAADLSRATLGGHSSLTAEVSGAALDALLDHSDGTKRSTLFAAFAAGAWRALFEGDAGITLLALDGSSVHVGQTGDHAVLTLVDLCDTRLGAYMPAGGGITLSVAKRSGNYALTLSFSEGAMPVQRAAALLDDIAARFEEPIRQLL